MSGSGYDADVIVAGAGPSGLMVSIEASLGGARVLTLEKRNGPTWSRAGTLKSRVLEMFASRGYADKFLKRAFELHEEPRSFDGIWAGLRPIHFGRLATDYPYVLFFAQIETEKMLAEEFRSLGGELRLQCEVTGLRQDVDGVDVYVREKDGASRTLRARYLVGADGNKSVVRNASGIHFSGHGPRRLAINIDAYVENPYATVLTVFHSNAGWAMAYPLRRGVTRLALIDAQTTHVRRHGALSEEEALAMLRRVHGSDFGITRIDAINTFHDAMYLADKLRDRRVFLVGESVRVHYPASGVGMNFCLQDAFNLGWKLAAAVTGRAPDDLLDTYSSERLPEIRALLDDVRRQCAIQFNFDDEHQALKNCIERDWMPDPAVNLRLCENLSGLSVRYPSEEGSHSIVGRRMPNLQALGAAGEETSVFELLRRQQFLLLDLTGTCLPTLRGGSDRVVVARVREMPKDQTLEGVGAVVVRPDGYVAGAQASGLASGMPSAAIARWLKAPLPRLS